MKFRNKPVVIEAVQWFKNGDHPDDDCYMIGGLNGSFRSEGKVVRRFRHPDIHGESSCSICNDPMHHHGWIDDLMGGRDVCPGDWIITKSKGEHYPCKPDIFEQTYESVIDVDLSQQEIDSLTGASNE